MRKLKSLFSLLMLICFSVGQGWAADELKATLDFTSNAWSLPEGSAAGLTDENSYSNGTYTIKLSAATKYYYHTSGYLIFGKTGSKLTLPAFSWKTTKIVVTGRSGASSAVGQNVYVGTTAVSTATTGATGTNTYNINSNYQAAGNVYVLQVTSNANTQVTKIEIYGESSSTSISIEKNGSAITELDFGEHEPAAGYTSLTFDLKASNLTAGVYLASSNIAQFKIAADNYPNGLAYMTVNPTDGVIDTTITILASTLTSGTYDDELSITSKKSTPEFSDMSLGLKLKVLGPEITLKNNSTLDPMDDVDFGNVGKYQSRSAQFAFSYKRLQEGTLTITVSDDFTFSGNSQTETYEITTASGTTTYVSIYKNTQTVKNITDGWIKFTGCGLPSSGVLYDVKMNVKNPVVSIDITSTQDDPYDFGNIKQHTSCSSCNDSEYERKTIHIQGQYLANDLFTGQTGSVFNIYPSRIYIDDDGSVDQDLDVDIYTGVAGTFAYDRYDDTKNWKMRIYSGAVTPEFEEIEIYPSVTIVPTYSVQAYSSWETGLVSVNGSTPNSSGKAYVEDNTEEVTITAIPNLGYAFSHWDADVWASNCTIADEYSATTTVTATAATQIRAWFTSVCTPLTYPRNPEVADKTYNSAELAWGWVNFDPEDPSTKLATYKVKVTEVGTDNVIIEDVSFTSADLAYTMASTIVTGLKANTDYKFVVWATTNASGYCEDGEESVEVEFTTNPYPSATLTLSENGTESSFGSNLKVADVVTLPSTVTKGVVDKVLVGWSSVEIATPTDTKPGAATFWDKGASYVIQSTADKLYAVYATATPGTPTNHDLGTATLKGTATGGNSASDGYSVQPSSTSNKDGYIQDNGTADVATPEIKLYVTNSETQIISSQPSAIKVVASLGGGSEKSELGHNVYAVLLDNNNNPLGDPVVLTTSIAGTSGTNYTASLPIANYSDVRGVKVYHLKENGYNVRYYSFSLKYETGGEYSYSGYVTQGARVLDNPTFSPAAGTYTTAQDITISATEGDIHYTINGADPTSASAEYTAAIALDTYGTYTIKAKAIDGDNASEVASSTYFMNLPFTSLEALVAAELESGTENVTVSFSDVEITDINNSNRSVYLNVKDKDGVNDIQLFNYNALEESWAVGGALSGTITCTWTLFNSNWELVITSWTTGITYAKPAPTLTWSASSATVKKGATDNVFPTLTNPDALSVSYSSTDETVATIASNGDITLLKAGTTTIKASFAGNDDYRAVVVSYELTVQKAAEGVLTLSKNVVDFGASKVGSSIGSQSFKLSGTGFTPNGTISLAFAGDNKDYFGLMTDSYTADANGAISEKNVEILVDETAYATYGVRDCQLKISSDDLASDSIVTIKLHVGAVITVTPAEPDLAFGEVLKGDDESKYTKTIHLNVTNMDPNCQLRIDPYAGFRVDGNYYRTPNAQGVIDVDLTFTPNTSSSVGVISGPLQFFSTGSPSQFSSPMVVATMSMTMIASTAITVPDISNGSLSWDGGAAPVVAKPGSEHTLAAVPASGYTGGEIAILKAENDNDVTSSVMSGSTLTVPDYAIKVVVSGFEATAHPSGLGWRYGGEDVTTHAHKFGTSTERFYFPSLKNPNEIDLDDIEFISSDSTVAEFGARTHEYSSWFAAVWVKKAGTAVMTARLKNHATYDDIEVSYTLTVSKGELADNQFRWFQYPDIYSPESDTYTWYESHSWPYINASSTYVDKANEVTYESTNTAVATISSTGSITPVANGSTVIKAKFIGNDMFNAKTVQFTLNVQKASPVLSWSVTPSTENTTVDMKNSFDLTAFPRFGSVSPNVEALRDLVEISSSDPTVAEINSNGYVNPLSAGTTTIKLSLDATDKSNAAEDISYTFTVNDSRPTLTIVAGDHGTYQVKDNSGTYVIESGSKVKANTNLYLVSQSAETGYKNTPVYKVVKTADNTDVTAAAINGSYLRMQAFDITISATYPEKAVAPIGWSSTETQYAYTDDRPYTLPTLVNAGLSVTITSSNTNVATYSNGKVTVLNAGTTNISVSYAGDGNYKQTTVSYELVVRAPNHLNVTGDLTKKSYDYGDAINCTGMTATLYYTEDNSDGVDVTDVANWFSTPATVTTGYTNAKITAAYKGKEGYKNVDVFMKKYTVTFSNPANAHGTIVVKQNGNAISTGDQFPKGTVLTVEATPDAGYALATLTANGDDIMATKQFSIGTEDVTIVATFTVALVGGECGKQGDNLLWQYNPTTKVLTITGSGEMADYTHSYSDGSNTTPWDQYRSDITSVVLPNGITSIGNWAFGNFKALTAITLPNTITVLGESAFNYSTALVSINMPTQLQTLGKMAFFNTRITSLTIPASVTSIGQQIVGAVTTLTAISVEAGNTVYDSRNNCNAIIRKSDNVLIVGCKNSTIPSDITGIADWAFDRGYAPATVELPADVTSIGEHAFYYGRAITLLRIPVGVTSISSQAFSSAFDADGADVYVEWTTPLVVFDDIVVATNVANATLHVPYGTKSLYEAANGWKHFGTIVEADKPTGLDDAMVSGDSQVRKVIIDSKLFIIRGDKMFDAQGKLVK